MTLWMTKRVTILWTTKLNGLQGFFGIIFSLFQWEILFSYIFAPLFCSFYYNRKWLHFEFHLISGIWRGRMCFLWLLSFIKKVTIVTFMNNKSHLDLDLKGHNCDLFMNNTISRSNCDLFISDTISRSNCDLFMNDTISRSNYDLFLNDTI